MTLASTRHIPSARKRALLFSMIGVVNTSVDVCVFYVLWSVASLSLLAANSISFVLACSLSYALNKRITFADRPLAKSAALLGPFSFVMTATVALIVSNFVVVTMSGLAHPLVGKLAAVVTSFSINYLGSNFIVFRR